MPLDVTRWFRSGNKLASIIHSRLFVASLIVLFCGGIYLLTLSVSPVLPAEKLTTLPPVLADQGDSQEGSREGRGKGQIIIPKIGVVSRIYTGEAWALNLGVWHRFPDRGDPIKGGNFIVSAHRFKLDWTPQKTRELSPFYHIDKLAVGDEIIVDYRGNRYTYHVTRIYTVSPNALEIEAPTEVARMTLYTCTLKGEADGRTVIEAILSN